MAIDRKAERALNRETLRQLLNSLAAVRQAKLDPDAENLYISALLGYDTRDVSEAIKQFGLEEVAEFKPRFPELGAITARVESLRDTRHRRPKFVSCGQCKGGYLITEDAQYSYAAECDCLKRWRGGQQAFIRDPMESHLEDVQAHPERYVPVDACIQVGKALAMARKERAGGSNPMGDAEFRTLQKKLTREMNEKWLEQLADRKTVAAGA